ncbi:50S ribosomal protein L25/general stress protein Ctc [Methylobacterium sp. E-041]|jgi:large subunit ribosomal protein L25|uniref:50S ribosomal protein L25/general stress protein Ctc n=1 Tax=unclassified Methylobacterium TaxID=2615210 RepID=UPI0011C9A91A|nr:MULTISPECIES: 50S ribosomal protein L25/general stress protein Ctc [unclassified Methylobacterium]MCJ2008497.1 50S ribosomal protein L25/general stress protein Ctc [Methylobacterium sp. J-092]MCJ2042305.1 50S ribosomal protein L25/general stress protein Ctc [Methylobacterium sp. J-059]MCJ2075918.1 50S ribosomal protein L25/general stress protein Ctc [Methylobacterium sp. E-016]MCJ2109542.1 50S ribosomal protein L25/general stress protein Ctc [Methylobacterium sp. E-041]MCJ2113708.1 50S ribo
MSAVKTLEAVARDRVGKGAARAVRRQGQVPAVVYGGGQPPQSIAIDLIRTRTLIYAGGFKTTLFEINAGGKKTRAIPRDFQLDPVSGVPMHVDFLRVVAGQTVTVEVPVHFHNEDAAPGIKQQGGTLNISLHTLAVEVAPDQIPDGIEIDLTGRQIGDVIHVSDVTLPAGVTYTGEAADPIANVVPPTVLGAEVEAEEAAIAEAQSAEAEAEKVEAEAEEAEATEEKKED